MEMPMSAAIILLKLKGFLSKYWLHILVGLLMAAAVWHYMDLRGDLRSARQEVVIQKQRADNAWAQVTAQNQAIERLNALNASLSRDIGLITTNNTNERRQLDALMGNLRGRINQLMTTPSAATPQEQCNAATQELRDVSEINNLLNRQ